MNKKRARILLDKPLLKFQDYEDYLESFITARDLYHLRSKSIARQIIELGYHTEGTLERDTFYKRVKAVKRHLYLIENPYELCSESVKLEDIFLKELALREKANRIEELYTIIFMRHAGNQSQISGYIDYNHRLKSEDWKPYFETTEKLMPTKQDLSYYDWKTGKSILNESPNFKPIINGKSGLLFQNVHNSKIIIANPTVNIETDPLRTEIYSDMYGPVILYDHYVQI